jgi:serine/threonine protein kinase
VHTNEALALKIEPKDAQHPQLRYEYLVLHELAGKPGVPRVVWFGDTTDGVYNAMIMQRLGPSVANKHALPLTPHVVGHVACHVLQTLQGVHAAHFIHRDLKPENILWAAAAGFPGAVFLIDFGLCKRYKTVDGHHISCRHDKSLVGTPQYAALRAHQGTELTRRDDVESFGLVMLYLSIGSLPWTGVTEATTPHNTRFTAMGSAKAAADIRSLVDALPRTLGMAIAATIHHGRSELGFADTPNYDRLMDLWAAVKAQAETSGAI